MQAQGSWPFGLSLAAALAASLGANALAGWLIPAGGWWAASGLGLQLTENAGVSFGLGSSLGLAAVAALGSVALVAAWVLMRERGGIGLGLLLGGGLANLADRIVDGRVTDYVAIGPWPTFNLADTLIATGVAVALTPLLRRR